MGADLIEGTWLKDFAEDAVIAYADMPDGDLVVKVYEGERAWVIFNLKLLRDDFQADVCEKLKGFSAGIIDLAERAGVGLPGLLIRIMEKGFDFGYISSECLELRLSLIEGWRGVRLLDTASDGLMELARKFGSQQASGKILSGKF